MASSVPIYGISGPFKGHLSTKSNAYSTGSGNSLSEQYRIRDHMLVHYNKILGAKAAVDCSIPKSMLKSVKYSDQLRREQMKKEMVQFERNISRPNSRKSADSVLLSKKDFYDDVSVRNTSYSDPGQFSCSSPAVSSPRQYAFEKNNSEKSWAAHGKCVNPRELSRMYCGSTNLSTDVSSCRSYSRFHDNQSKTYSGDLLDKNPELFKNSTRPFTPRTLKTGAKSVLSQYRYYTPPRRKRKDGRRVTQTGADSTMDGFDTPKKKEKETEDHLSNSDKESLFSEGAVQNDAWSPTDWNELANTWNSSSRLIYNEEKPPSLIIHKIQSKEEELAYLKFVTDITNEVLALGLFSNRVLEQVFKRHVQENRNCLDERKMCLLLDNLREDLSCKDNSTETNHYNMVKTVDEPTEKAYHFSDRRHLLQEKVFNGTSKAEHESFFCERGAEMFQDVANAEKSENTTDLQTIAVEDSEDFLSVNPRVDTQDDQDPEQVDNLHGTDDLEKIFSELVHVTEELEDVNNEETNSQLTFQETPENEINEPSDRL
ncbi:hypothetical protein GDO86_015908 [Hymenochirus boettgeri]|uniref:Spermatogenesis associated 7 n=1 Tax=Hymenochirus boettgeri TaxID=247094 RepID=A0A8T2JUW0_9PIPI|nr:hypothetical protein GDO86_015908 [Hymenochirus boettgeri]KAG8449020.1 hypothetical protein GDO86_015908 [Hymenochirus boettgeri]